MDLINRQDAIENITMWLNHNGYSEGERNVMGCTIQMLECLPSAEPVIRCKDCKYFEQYTDDGTFESVLKMHQWDGECSEWVGHTYMGWFCSRAERRTDERLNQQTGCD